MKHNWKDKSVLIVEDTKTNQFLFKCILEHTEIDITTAFNSVDFFNVIGEKKYDLVLMDINLGEELTGIDLIRYMQKNNYDIPIIIQTAYSNCYDISDNIKYESFITKPIKIGELYQKMSLILDK